MQPIRVMSHRILQTDIARLDEEQQTFELFKSLK
jgi:hypothetical protein